MSRAQNLPFSDASFDLATCRFAVMFFADVGLALRELNRVLRPGARACFAAWGPFEQPYGQSTMGVVLKHVGGPAIAPGEEDPFRFARTGSLSSALRDAGFEGAKDEIRPVPWLWPGEPEEVWEYAQAVSAAFRGLLGQVPAEKWPALNAEGHAAIRKYTREGGIHFGAAIVFAAGEKK